MRLIDADKLIEICDKGWRLGGAINTKIYHTVDASDIRSQPTVKAIPIEWIKDKMDELEGTGRFELSEYLVELLADWENNHKSNVRRLGGGK